MSEQTYNDQDITLYLLGSLPEAETERLDELSLTDDEFANVLNAAEKDLVDAYAQGELAGTALKQFESHYLASPLRRGKVEFAQAFQALAEKNAAAQVVEAQAENLAGSATKRKGSRWFSALNIFRVQRPALQWGTAFAALALLMAGGWLAFENARLRQQVSQTRARRDVLGQREQELQKEIEGQHSASAKTEQELARAREERERLEQALKQQEAQEQQRATGERRAPEQQRAARQHQPSPGGVRIASFVLAPQMRGVGQIPLVSVPAKTDYAAMRLELEPNDYPAYRVVLLDQSSNQTLWRSNKLKPRVTDDGKTLSISFPANLLRPQVYVLRVTGVSANGVAEIVSDHPFRVVR